MSPGWTPSSFPAKAREAVNRERKLGRGLNALLDETRREERVDTAEAGPGTDKGVDGTLRMLAVDSIRPLAGQPRTRFDPEALDQLAASIAARGLIQPVLVQPAADGGYTLVAGERRWRAAQIAKLEVIPAIVRRLEPREVMALALVENLQREDLSPLEEARAYQRLANDEGLTQADIAAMVDKSRSHVANLQRLLTLPPAVQDLLERNQLSMGHARALVGHEDAETLALRAVRDGLSVRDMESAARTRARSPARPSGGPASHHADIAAVETHLQEFLGMPIRIKAEADPRRGTITIQYRTLDQLDLLCQRLTGGDL